jgi:TldD protein
MQQLAGYAVEAARASGAELAEARLVYLREETLRTRNAQVSDLARSETLGIGVRVIVDGAWGYAAFGGDLDRAQAQQTARRAVALGRAAARVRLSPVRLAPEPPHHDTWVTPTRTNPFSVPLADKVALAAACDEAMLAVPGCSVARSLLYARQEHTWFASSDGAAIEQTLFCTGGGLMATATSPDEIQIRSYPNRWGQFASGGYEVLEDMKLLENAGPTAETAVELLTADPCPATTTDLIVGASHLALQIHESVGHPTELDRVLGLEANMAGTSFATVEKLGKLQYGAPIVNLVADGTVPGGVATRGYDDEGVASQRWHLVRDGRLAGYLMSRETAATLGLDRSNGTVRADGFGNIPMIRQTNISLMPREGSLDDLIADTRDGLLVDTCRSWSIDQQRVNFQFGTEVGWLIRNGRRARLVKNATYGGRTVPFWNSCDAVCGPDHWTLWGLMNCGKGEPLQVARMSHGAAPARFRSVDVGVSADG